MTDHTPDPIVDSVSEDPTERIAPTYLDVLRTNADARQIAQEVVDAEPGWIETVAKEAGKEAGAKAGTEAGSAAGARIGLIGLIAVILISLLLSGLALGNSIATDREVDNALQRLGQANVTLQSRGQEPIAVPPTDADDPAGVIAAAVTAQVLASLPATPTADQVADRLQGVVIGSLSGPSMEELARLVAVYFRDNPPQPGPAPTQGQIQAAVDRAIAANPPAPGRDGASPACLSQPQQCQGRDGANGTNGVNGTNGTDGRSLLTGPEPVRVNGGCVWRSTYSAPPLTVETPAGEAACPGTGGQPAPDEGGILGFD